MLKRSEGVPNKNSQNPIVNNCQLKPLVKFLSIVVVTVLLSVLARRFVGFGGSGVSVRER